jgi:chromosome segregation ATPase
MRAEVGSWGEARGGGEAGVETSEATEAVELYLEGSAVDAAQGPALRRALDLRQRLAAVQSDLQRLDTERRDIERTLHETRANLEAIKKVEGAADLRQRLVQRISDMDTRSDRMTREMVEKRTEESELRVRLDEAVREITLVVDPGKG